MIEKLSREIFKTKNSITKPKVFDPTKENKLGYTLAQWWIIHRNTKPPSWMKHDPLIQNYYGNTCFMLWVKYAKNKLKFPKWIYHDPMMTNCFDKSVITLWYYYSIDPMPFKITDEIEQKCLLEDLIIGSELTYTNGMMDVLDLCKSLRKTITPQQLFNLYLPYSNGMSEERIHERVSQKYSRIIEDGIVKWNLTNVH